jgi:hypothetical protein
MNPVNLLQTHYDWTPNYRQVFKKPVPQGLKTFRVPQTTGTPGWILFTFEKNAPVCYFVNAHECTPIPCIVDERICGDTFLRVEKVSDLEFVVADIWMYNSNCVFACSTFEQRYNWLKRFLPTCFGLVEGTARFIHKENAEKYAVRGYEEYGYELAKPGYFVERETNTEEFTIRKLAIPDCYELENDRGYLRVPDLKTSIYLRSRGDMFVCKCVPFDDEYWDVVENIPEIE